MNTMPDDIGYQDYVAPIEICNRCIVIVNASTAIRARIKGNIVYDFQNFFDMKALIEWARSMVIAGADIEMNAQAHTFEAISTWNGDPVCQPHLWECRDRELRGHK